MKFILFMAIQCILSSVSAAPAAVPVEAKELKKALAKYQAMSSLEVTFKQTKILKDIQLELKSEGLLKVRLPNRVEWRVLKPQPLDMVLEQDQVTLISEGKQQTFRTSEGSAKDQRAFHDLLDWLRLDADALLQNYDVTELAKNSYRFAAKKDSMGMKALIMNLKKTGHVDTLVFEEAAGDEIRIRFGTPKVKYRSGP